eukprot:187949-Alexandrium_andersonii.AAC.1
MSPSILILLRPCPHPHGALPLDPDADATAPPADDSKGNKQWLGGSRAFRAGKRRWVSGLSESISSRVASINSSRRVASVERRLGVNWQLRLSSVDWASIGSCVGRASIRHQLAVASVERRLGVN